MTIKLRLCVVTFPHSLNIIVLLCSTIPLTTCYVNKIHILTIFDNVTSGSRNRNSFHKGLPQLLYRRKGDAAFRINALKCGSLPIELLIMVIALAMPKMGRLPLFNDARYR